MSFATKLCHIVPADGSGPRDVMKQPQTDPSKFSLPGQLAVKRVAGVPTVFPADSGEVAPEEDMLQVCACSVFGGWGIERCVGGSMHLCGRCE
jgi:nicotinamide phosphoribosyltransferase